jgi:glycosyltransferase involved in cell wall biosynthesis
MVLVSIIIPVYNEKPTLAEVVRRVVEAPLPAGCDREVIVVDDGSCDGTAAALDECGRRHASILLQRSAMNEGKGSALRAGIARSSGDVILVQDGDLEYDPRDYISVLQPIVDGRADVVYGSRFLGGVRGMKAANRVANKILTMTANVLFDAGITDEATAYKAFRASALERIELRCRRFEFCPEVTAKLRRLGYRIHEVPIRYCPRSVEQGKKIRVADGFHAMFTLIRYRLATRRSFAKEARGRAGIPAVGPIG